MPDPSKIRASSFTEMKSKAWLSWLARGMQKHSQTVFMLEQLQPSWLPSRWQRWLYILSSRAIAGLPVGLIVLASLALAEARWNTLFTLATASMCGGVFAGLCVGIID